jgi:hypothetical protein
MGTEPDSPPPHATSANAATPAATDVLIVLIPAIVGGPRHQSISLVSQIGHSP